MARSLSGGPLARRVSQIKILRQLRHPHIVQLKEVVTTEVNTYIVMELCAAAERQPELLH